MSDLTTEILIQIRDGVHGLGERLDQTNAKLDQTNAKLDQTRAELGARIDQTNRRLDRTRTELIAKLDQTNAKLDQTRTELLGKIDGTNTRLGRLEDGVSTLIGQVTILADRDRGLGDTVADLQRRVEALEQSAHG